MSEDLQTKAEPTERTSLTVDEIREGLDSTAKGGVKNSIKNCVTVFCSDPLFKDAIKHNILTERTDIVKPLGWQRLSSTLTDTDMPYILLYLEDNYGLTNEKKIESALRIIANENQYHPIRDYLNGLVWDGQERIRYALHRYLGADTDDFTYECLRLFMMGAIRRVFKPGCKFELMLCLVGGQGAGKSTFFRFLSVRDEWFSDDLKKLDDENVYPSKFPKEYIAYSLFWGGPLLQLLARYLHFLLGKPKKEELFQKSLVVALFCFQSYQASYCLTK